MSRTAVPIGLSWFAADVSALDADAARAGLSRSAYLRSLWLAARPRERDPRTDPRPGDVVWVPMWKRALQVGPSGHADGTVWILDGAFSAAWPIDEWRAVTDGAQVLRVAS